MSISGNQSPRGWGFNSPCPNSHAGNSIEVKIGGKWGLCCRRMSRQRRDSGKVLYFESFSLPAFEFTPSSSPSSVDELFVLSCVRVVTLRVRLISESVMIWEDDQ